MKSEVATPLTPVAIFRPGSQTMIEETWKQDQQCNSYVGGTWGLGMASSASVLLGHNRREECSLWWQCDPSLLYQIVSTLWPRDDRMAKAFSFSVWPQYKYINSSQYHYQLFSDYIRQLHLWLYGLGLIAGSGATTPLPLCYPHWIRYVMVFIMCSAAPLFSIHSLWLQPFNYHTVTEPVRAGTQNDVPYRAHTLTAVYAEDSIDNVHRAYKSERGCTPTMLNPTWHSDMSTWAAHFLSGLIILVSISFMWVLSFPYFPVPALTITDRLYGALCAQVYYYWKTYNDHVGVKALILAVL